MANVNFGSSAYGGPNGQYLQMNTKVGVSQEDIYINNPLRNEALITNLNQSQGESFIQTVARKLSVRQGQPATDGFLDVPA